MKTESLLAGRTALVLREFARSIPTVQALRASGASAAVCQLIDFELPQDTGELDDSVGRLAAGEFDWLVLTSVNTVRALAQRATALGCSTLIPASTRIAVVGEATALALRQLGRDADFMPTNDHSARGMLAEFPQAEFPKTEEQIRVFMPQADIASATLRDGFAVRGNQAHVVIAYRTVSAPADPSRALHGPAEHQQVATGSSVRVVGAHDLPAAMAGLDAIFFSSPSTVDELLKYLPSPPAHLALVAIGESTADRLRGHGLEPTATANFPTPEGLVDAWEQALGTHPLLLRRPAQRAPHT